MIRHFLREGVAPLAVALLPGGVEAAASRGALVVGAIASCGLASGGLAAGSVGAVALAAVTGPAQLHLRATALADVESVVGPHRIGEAVEESTS